MLEAERDELIAKFKKKQEDMENYMRERGDVPDEVNKWELEGSDNSVWENGFMHGLFFAILEVREMAGRCPVHPPNTCDCKKGGDNHG